MQDKKKSGTVFDDIDRGKGYILGVLAFATAVSVFLTQAFHFAVEPTLITIAGFAIVLLFIGLLIGRSEQRQSEALREHEHFSQQQVSQMESSLVTLTSLALQTQQSNARIELTMMMRFQPHNHDTIIKQAQHYFCTLHGNWTMTSDFLSWAEAENEAAKDNPAIGKVHIPPELMSAIQINVENEKNEG